MDIYDGLENESYDRKYKDSKLLKRIFDEFKQHKKSVFIIVSLVVLVSLLEILIPITISNIINVIVESHEEYIVLIMAVSLIIIGVIKWTCNYFNVKLNAKVISDVILDLRKKLYKSVLEQELDFFNNQFNGKIVNRIMNDTSGVANVIKLLIELSSQLLIMVFLIIWLVNINFTLTSILVVMMFFSISISISFRYLVRRFSAYARRSEAKVSSTIQESISGMMTAKIFRREGVIFSEFLENNNQYYKIHILLGLVYCIIYPLMAIFSGLGLAILIYFACNLYKIGELSAGDWVLFIQTEAYFWYPMMKITSFWSLFQDGLSAAERVYSLLDLEKSILQTGSETFEDVVGDFQFNDVSFAYEDGKYILNHFNLKINKGEKVALVGKTGAGKTTILKLIARYNEFMEGNILVNGKDIRSLDIGSYRKKLGIISQDPYIFAGTVADNIKYGCPDISNEEVMKVAMKIDNGEWLEDLSDGINTRVGENGATLSVGQKQLIAIARVILKDSDVLILDEATANIDPFTEYEIQRGLAAVMENKTVIMVAHRISTLNNADRIIVIEEGNIVEEGTQNELLSQKGVYQKLYNEFYDLK